MKNEYITVEYIKGELFLSNGQKVSFTLDETGFTQNGLEKEKLWFTHSILEALSKTFAEQVFEIEESYQYNEN
jgi:hypothetical protein